MHDERLVPLRFRHRRVDHLFGHQRCDATDLGLPLPLQIWSIKEPPERKILGGPPARPRTLSTRSDSPPLVAWWQVMNPCIPRPLNRGSVVREIAIVVGHCRPAILALNCRDGALDLDVLARSDAIVEEMVALGKPSLTLGGHAKDGVRDRCRDLPLQLLRGKSLVGIVDRGFTNSGRSAEQIACRLHLLVDLGGFVPPLLVEVLLLLNVETAKEV